MWGERRAHRYDAGSTLCVDSAAYVDRARVLITHSRNNFTCVLLDKTKLHAARAHSRCGRAAAKLTLGGGDDVGEGEGGGGEGMTASMTALPSGLGLGLGLGLGSVRR